MRLAVVSKYPPNLDGVSEYGRYIIDGLASRPEVGHLSVIANAAKSASADVASPIEVRRVWRAGEPWLGGRILREIARVKPSAIWYNISLSMFGETGYSLGGFALPFITRGLGIRSVVTLHERCIDRLGDLGVSNSLSRRAGVRAAVQLLLLSHVVCVTTDEHRRTLEAWPAPGRARITHVPLCGYEEPTFEPVRDSATILMLTSHAPHKNLPLVIDAFRRLRPRIPSARLVIAGVDHPRFPGYLCEMRRRFAAEPGIDWRGPLPSQSLRSTIGDATIVVVPYRVTTGSSATVHQAISAGRPVIAADLPELRSMAEEERLWLEFFSPDNSEHLVRALERLLTDSNRWSMIARHNLTSARQNTLAATTDRYIRVLRGREEPASSSIAISGCRSGAPSR